MRAIKDIFHIKAEKEINNELDVKGHDGKNLFLDTDFKKYHYAVQCGEVVSTPIAITPYRKRYNPNNDSYEDIGFRNKIEIKVGDKLYFHHFVVGENNFDIIDGQKLYRCHYQDIYCIIRDSKIIMIEDWLLIEPILESEENYQKNIGGIILLTKPNPEFIKQRGVIAHLSDMARENELEVGDEIYFAQDADYNMKIEGKEYYRMKLANILLKYINN